MKFPETGENRLLNIYYLLLEHFGKQNWWPANTRWEVIVGAILTQNTTWSNVERAIDNLKVGNTLELEKIYELRVPEIAKLIRPTGYYNQKAKKLSIIASHIVDNYDGSLNLMFDKDADDLRDELLSLWGIGRETCDSIILYAAGKPLFIIDNYTRRILIRHRIIDEDMKYDEVQSIFMDNIEPDTDLYQEYHALLVKLGKEFCKKREPLCSGCPIKSVDLYQ